MNSSTFLVLVAAMIGLATSMAQAFIDVTKPPTSVEVIAEEGKSTSVASELATVTFKSEAKGLSVQLKAPSAGVRTIKLHWAGTLKPGSTCLGDRWERAYIDLGWKPIDKSGAMPWYFLHRTGDVTDAYGVMTGPHAMVYWEANESGVTLVADVRSGGVGVELGERTLDVCTIVTREGKAGEDVFDVAVDFCKQMCPKPRLPKMPVYGFNDWNSTYGHNTAEKFLRDATTLAQLAPAGENRPYMVVDDGWQGNRQDDPATNDPWEKTNAKFGSSMAELAKQVHGLNAKFGLWYRPVEAPEGAAKRELLRGRVFDPTVPSVKRRIARDVARFKEWKVDLIKFDFTTQEIFGRFGDHMDPLPASDDADWTFANRSKTSAEVVLDLYQTIRDAAGDDIVIDGCNTISHLSAGLFELYRAGDDTSGREWHRTKYGVNCLAFRGAQQGTFYQVDPDMVGLAGADAIPWAKNKQWLDLVASSGTTLIVSWKTELMDDTIKTALRDAFAKAAKPQPVARPLDGEQTPFPTRWKLGDNVAEYNWE